MTSPPKSALRTSIARAYAVTPSGQLRRIRRELEQQTQALLKTELALAERDSWVAGLNTALSEREGWVTDLSAELARHREWVATGHYYSAVPSLEHLEHNEQRIRRRDRDAPGVDLRLDAQRQLLLELEPMVADVPFTADPSREFRYHYDNDFFAHTDGMFLHLLLRHLQPRQVVEVGSGYSSALTLDTIEGFLPDKVDLTFIEPFDERLRSLLHSEDAAHSKILTKPVQEVDLAVFEQLRANDLLFVDSTHAVKAGGDVNWLFFEILPRLASGVVVHVHDILPGFEYHWDWLTQGRAWTEAYLLRAFLQYNDSFEILLWPSLLAEQDPTQFAQRFIGGPMSNFGGSIYLRRR
jgi:predicted O-methyltransferase YrrM